MKKFIGVLMALVMMMSLTVMASAADQTITSVTSGNTVTIPLTGTGNVTCECYSDIVYKVTIEWSIPDGYSNFNFTGTGNYTWNPDELVYEGDVDFQLPDNGQIQMYIEIDNYSNAKVRCDATYDNTNVTSGLSCNCVGDYVICDSADTEIGSTANPSGTGGALKLSKTPTLAVGRGEPDIETLCVNIGVYVDNLPSGNNQTLNFGTITLTLSAAN